MSNNPQDTSFGGSKLYKTKLLPMWERELLAPTAQAKEEIEHLSDIMQAVERGERG